MIKANSFIMVISSLLLLLSCQPDWIKKAPVYDYEGMDGETKNVHKKVEKFLARALYLDEPIPVHPASRIREVRIDREAQHIDITLNKPFSYIPFREESVNQLYETLYQDLPGKYKRYTVALRTLDQPIEALIPNYYRSDPSRYDSDRMPEDDLSFRVPLVRNISKPWLSESGLYNHNIALWHSHGWYYNPYIDRWEWQRPRLFQTVEDLLPLSFTLPYLVPMLENAGANVFIPRERDIQTEEIVVDNDSLGGRSQVIAYSENRTGDEAAWFSGEETAFGIGSPPYGETINPFRLGTHRYTLSASNANAHIDWIPHIKKAGHYAVYVAYVASNENVDDAHYTVYHAGGQTEFLVNQQIGGRTWVYLGTFYFEEGFNPERARVRLDNKSRIAGKKVSADAVRFGGGMGQIARNGQSSGRPKFLEASRYYLQYAGFPDSLVYSLSNGKNDYTDDYKSRPEYVNFLKGAPFGPNRDRQAEGMGIPIDLSLAFHTDAGITRNDTTIGTLLIYSVEGADSQFVFPDSVSRLANRDFADILQTQLVEDIRQRFDPQWNRRQLRDAGYSEAYRPNVPAALLELLSHQNFLDMRFALDPRFRFFASRSMYKAMLKFIHNRYEKSPVVQPLPVTHLRGLFSGDGDIVLNWKPAIDPLESSATPDRYVVYTSEDGGGFDNGTPVSTSEFTLRNPKKDIIYRFKVTAVNTGGESFPSEIISACIKDDAKKPVLIINGFDRICGPSSFSEENLAGFFNLLDSGVPDKYDLNFTGLQHDYSMESPFRLNDAPGHGASFADFETTVIPGNSFDYPFLHGKSIRDAGYSFVSSSDEAVMDSLIDLSEYNIIDLILGEEKQTGWQRSKMDTVIGLPYKTFPEKMKRQIKAFTATGGNLFISGAHIGSDLFEGKIERYPDVLFARFVLKFNWVTNHAARTGRVIAANDSIFAGLSFQFNTGYHPDIYTVEAPDAIAPVSGAQTIMRYAENSFSAATAYDQEYGLVIMGFPFESIIDEAHRHQLMNAVLRYFESR